MHFLYVIYIYYMAYAPEEEIPKKHKNLGLFFGTIVVASIVLGILMYKILQDNRQNPTLFANNAAQQRNKMQQGQGKNQMQGQREQQGNRFNKQNCLGDECLQVNNMQYPAGELSQQARDALKRALEDEYKAHATYESVIAKIGMERPFSMVIRAEEQHISLLKSLYDKYGLQIPENNWTGAITVPSSLQAACQVGVKAETENVRLYKEELLPIVKDYPDLTSVFTNLMNASQNKHLPAFQRCQ